MQLLNVFIVLSGILSSVFGATDYSPHIGARPVDPGMDYDIAGCECLLQKISQAEIMINHKYGYHFPKGFLIPDIGVVNYLNERFESLDQDSLQLCALLSGETDAAIEMGLKLLKKYQDTTYSKTTVKFFGGGPKMKTCAEQLISVIENNADALFNGASVASLDATVPANSHLEELMTEDNRREEIKEQYDAICNMVWKALDKQFEQLKMVECIDQSGISISLERKTLVLFKEFIVKSFDFTKKNGDWIATPKVSSDFNRTVSFWNTKKTIKKKVDALAKYTQMRLKLLGQIIPGVGRAVQVSGIMDPNKQNEILAAINPAKVQPYKKEITEDVKKTVEDYKMWLNCIAKNESKDVRASDGLDDIRLVKLKAKINGKKAKFGFHVARFQQWYLANVIPTDI